MSHAHSMPIRWLSLAIALGSIAALPGCDLGIDLSGPGPDRSVPEVHGRHISSAGESTPITWSPSGEEVTFISGDYRMAYAHHPQSGAMRQLYASNTLRDRIVDAQLSADGVDWFTTSFHVESGTDIPNVVRRHTSAGSTVLTDRGSAHPSTPPLMRWVLVAPSQPVVAFIVSLDGLFLLRRGGEPTLLGNGCYGVVAFSPDESRVLCSVGSVPSSFRVFRMDGGAAESLDLPDEVAEEAQVIRWDAKGIQVLYSAYDERFSDGWGYLLYEQASGSSRPLTPAYQSEFSTGKMSWSSDGRKVAYWNSFCAQIGGLFGGCRKTQAFLYVLDVATGTTTRVAVHTSRGNSFLRVAVSPTGSMVAYNVNGGFYLLDVR